MKGCVFLNYLGHCRDQVVEVEIKRRRSYGRLCYVIDLRATEMIRSQCGR